VVVGGQVLVNRDTGTRAQRTIHGTLAVHRHRLGVEIVLPDYVAAETESLLLSYVQAAWLVDGLLGALGAPALRLHGRAGAPPDPQDTEA
jgi:hypothetical protein